MSGYAESLLVHIGALLRGIEAAEGSDTVGGLYVVGPIEVRDSDVSYGTFANEDGLWTFTPHEGGPRDV